MKTAKKSSKTTPKVTHDFAKAKDVVSALLSGIDPDSGEELTGNPILQRVGVLRSLITAVTALDMTNARARRRAQLPSSVGKLWTNDEEIALVAAFQQGNAIDEIAKLHSRTVRAIEVRLTRLGIIPEGHHNTGKNPFHQK